MVDLHRLARSLGLRRKFSASRAWEAGLQRRSVTELPDDIYRFLEHADKPRNFWERFLDSYSLAND